MADRIIKLNFANDIEKSQKLTFCQLRGGVTTKNVISDTKVIFDFSHSEDGMRNTNLFYAFLRLSENA